MLNKGIVDEKISKMMKNMA